MTKNTYSKNEVEKMILSHPLFGEVKGTYLLFQNTNFSDTKEQNFSCTEREFQNFVTEILRSVLALSSVPASLAPHEWAPLPGFAKEEIRNRFQEAANIYKEILQEDPHIVVIKKTQDKGRSVSWNR